MSNRQTYPPLPPQMLRWYSDKNWYNLAVGVGGLEHHSRLSAKWIFQLGRTALNISDTRKRNKPTKRIKVGILIRQKNGAMTSHFRKYYFYFRFHIFAFFYIRHWYIKQHLVMSMKEAIFDRVKSTLKSLIELTSTFNWIIKLHKKLWMLACVTFATEMNNLYSEYLRTFVLKCFPFIGLSPAEFCFSISAQQS
jgi:hypothetical protein